FLVGIVGVLVKNPFLWLSITICKSTSRRWVHYLKLGSVVPLGMRFAKSYALAPLSSLRSRVLAGEFGFFGMILTFLLGSWPR
ncbi:hypothetical protein LINPERPRIM_LOCUS21611, partial [Linum perenne]